MWNQVNKFVKLLKQNNIEFTELLSQDIEIYKHEWFNKFVPQDKHKEAIDSYCFDKDDYSGFLWHAFSYEIISCLVGLVAKKAFDQLEKQEAVLLINIDDVAYRIKDISKLTSKDFEILDDIILTDKDFKWTYTKTHESACGPYFHCL